MSNDVTPEFSIPGSRRIGTDDALYRPSLLEVFGNQGFPSLVPSATADNCHVTFDESFGTQLSQLVDPHSRYVDRFAACWLVEGLAAVRWQGAARNGIRLYLVLDIHDEWEYDGPRLLLAHGNVLLDLEASDPYRLRHKLLNDFSDAIKMRLLKDFLVRALLIRPSRRRMA